MAKYSGTRGNDLFRLSGAQLKSSTVSGGEGIDTLAIAETGNFTFSSTTFSSLSSIEVFDFSAHQTGTLSVLLSSTMMAQSETGKLTVLSGAGGIDNLKAGSSVGGTVIVGGTGHVMLDGATNNIVSIADGSTVQVHGGAGSDTIRAGSGGAFLDGGAGNDTLVAGSGTDTIKFGVGYRADVVSGFNVAADKVLLTGTAMTYFSEVMTRVTDTANGAVLDLGNGDRLTLSGVTSDQLTAANFSGIQAGAPTYYIDATVTAATLNQMLLNAGDGATFILRDGLHVFDAAIRITHDNVTFKGESETGTILRFNLAAGAETDSIQVTGNSKALVGVLASDVAAHATQISLASVAGLKAGDTLYVSQANDAAYMTANGWTNVTAADVAKYPFREAHVQIDHIEGNTVYLTHEVPFAMNGAVAQVYKTDLVHGLQMSDFTVDSGLGAANANNFVNTLPAYLGIAAIRLDGVAGVNLSHISILNPQSLGFDIHGGLDITGDHLSVSGAWNKGSGGNGYGLQIGELFNSSFTNLNIMDTRHAVLFSGWDSEANNYVHVSATNRDINFHGGPDTGNVVVVDFDALSYNPTQDTSGGNGYWTMVGDNVTTHANIDPYAANSVVFSYAVGFDAADRIFGTANGAYLNGRGGADTLTGGAGNDTLVGGLGKDVMTGGAGADLILVRAGDNYDTITDFDTSATGDRIVLSGTGAAETFADLVITQVGSDVAIRYGANGTITLANQAVGDLSAANFIFDPTGAMYGQLF